MKYERELYKEQKLFNSRENSGMMHISRIKRFQVGDWVLLYDSRFKENPGKFQTRWLGPYKIQHVFDNSVVQLTTIDPV